MAHSFDIACVADLRSKLNDHPIYRAVRNLDDARVFVEHHVYSIWDFMPLAKALQQAVAPSGVPWLPPNHRALRRFINETVLEEESDVGLPDAHGRRAYLSHFELYCQAMREIGADDSRVSAFIGTVRHEGIRHALVQNRVPMAAR